MVDAQANTAIQQRRHLFHAQAQRFSLCEARNLTREDLRALWKSTGFPTL